MCYAQTPRGQGSKDRTLAHLLAALSVATPKEAKEPIKSEWFAVSYHQSFSASATTSRYSVHYIPGNIDIKHFRILV